MAELIIAGEQLYLLTCPDVREVIQRGAVANAKEHYVRDGYFENRQPRQFVVDSAWYLTQYPDDAAAIRSGRIKSPQHHFNVDGFKEGRYPYSDWSL